MEVYVNEPVLPLYKGYESERIIEDEVLYGMQVSLLEESFGKERVHIRTHYGYEGYVEKKGLYLNSAHQYEEKDHRVYIAHPIVDVLSAPKVQGEILITLPLGCELIACEEADANGWVKVQLISGAYGYVKASYLRPYQQSTITDEMTLREQLVATAMKYLGTQYRWGGKSTYGIDCSGLCSMAYLLNGITIFRDAKIEEGFPVHEIPRENLKRGDLLYFKGHMAMWLGNDEIIHSTAKKGREGVVIDSIDPTRPNARMDLWDIYLMSGSIF